MSRFIVPDDEHQRSCRSSLASTREHLGLIAERLSVIEARRNVLTVAADEAFEQALAVLGRGLWTVDEALELWAWASTLPVKSPKQRLADALEVPAHTITSWTRCHPHSVVRGPFPVLAEQPLPYRGRQCVYILLDHHKQALYIGVSGQVRQRLKQHAKDSDRSAVVSFEIHQRRLRAEAEQLEADLIFQHQPPQNVAGRLERLVRDA
jgi:nucleotide-binding universal stress UspA family protein